MALNSSSLSLFTTFCIAIFLLPFVCTAGEDFSVALIHRDNPKSPYENSSNSNYERLHHAFLRSFRRKANLEKQTLNTMHTASEESDEIQSRVISTGGEYLMQASIGTPPYDFIAIADTGSDLTWLQCEPCRICYKQNAPLFDPSNSSTYANLACNSQKCAHLVGSSSCDNAGSCGYQYSYADNSFTTGNLATETLTFQSRSGKNVSIPNVIIGCAHQNGGTFDEHGAGLIGIGGGELSIINQLGEFVDGKFSYCLVPFESGPTVSSRFSLGKTAVVTGPNTVSTPMFKQKPDTFYYLNIEGVSVQNASNVVNGSSAFTSSEPSGNIVIDSGTTLTYLPRQMYDDLEATLKKTISGIVVSDPRNILSLCYQAGQGTQFPGLVVHFTGADLFLPSTSIFFQTSEDAICLTLGPTDDLAIFGNLAQINYRIGYDLVNKTVSFQPTDCTKND